MELNTTIFIYRRHDLMYKLKDTHRKKLELINKFIRDAGYKINTQKSIVFLYIINKQSKNEITIQFTVASKNKTFRNKFNTNANLTQMQSLTQINLTQINLTQMQRNKFNTNAKI